MKHHLGQIALTALLLATPGLSSGQHQPLEEYQVKAAFLFNFARFVSWPTSAPDSTKSFRIGIHGKDPFGKTLDDLVAGESVGSRPITLFRSSELSRLDSCQIVFVPACEDVQAQAVIEGLNDGGTLIVGEQDGFAELGGAIEFVIDRSRVNFIINMAAIRMGGLSASSKLQRVAKQVID